MKPIRILFNTLAMLAATASGAFAAETVKVYSSSMLVLAFVGFLALVVIIQLIPAILTLIGSLKGIAKNEEDDSVMAKIKAGR
ncbi:MAG TPA: hypothetical protein VMJ66_00795 [Geobacteraceae bacterium]|nr:hypothetical protein [Geobacteraceae bacterium]